MGLKKIGKATAPRSFGTGGAKITPSGRATNTLNNVQSTYKSTSRKENAFDKLFDLANEVAATSIPKSAPKFTLPSTTSGVVKAAGSVSSSAKKSNQVQNVGRELAAARRSRAGSDVIKELQEKQSAYLEEQRLEKQKNGSSGGFLNWLGNNAAAGLSQFNKAFASTLDFFLPTELVFGEENDPISWINTYYQDQANLWAQNAANANEESGTIMGGIGQYLVQPVVNAGPQALLAFLSGGKSLLAQGGTAGLQATSSLANAGGGLVSTINSASQALAKNPSFWTSVLQTTGPAYDEAKAGGATDLEATATALITGLLNSAVEIGGGIEALPAGLKNNSAVRQWVKSSLEEGREEVVQGVIENLVQKAVYDRDKAYFSMEDQNAIVNPVRAAQEFAGGVAAGGVLGGGGILANSIVNRSGVAQSSSLESLANEMATERLSQIPGFTQQETQPKVQTTAPAQPRMQAQNQQQTQAQQSTALLDRLRQQTSTLSNRQAEQVLSDRDAVATLQQKAGLDLSEQDTLAKRRSAVKQSFERYDTQQKRAETVQNNADMMNSFGENGQKAFISEVRKTGDAAATYPEFSRAYVEGLTGAEQAADLSPTAQAAYYAGQNDAAASREQAPGFSESDYSGSVSEEDRSFYDTLGKATGTNISIVAPTGENGYNGYYENGEIYIAADAENPGRVVVAHEVTHRLQEIAPVAYTKFRDYAVAAVSGQGGADAMIQAYIDRYAKADVALTREGAMDEIAADYAQRLMIDEEAIRRVVADDRSLAQKFVDTIKDLIQRVKQAFSGKEARAEIKQLEKARDLWLDALRTGNTQVSRLRGNRADATMEKTQYSMKEGTDYGRENEIGRGSQKSGQTGYGQGLDGKGEQVSGGVRRNLSDASGRYGGVDPSFGADPVRTWANGHTLEPAKGSVSYAEQQTAAEYGVPSFVVDDATWTENKGSDPAFSAGGQIYFRETLPENRRGMFAPHELTHVMRQVGYQPYLDFVDRTPEMLNMSSSFTLLLLDHVAKHQGTNTSNADPTRLYDELNATIYGHYAAGKTKDLSGPLHQAFYDFDAYIAELSDLHERFKLENGEKAQYSLKGTSQLQRQVQNLQERNAYLKEQMKRSTSIKTDRKKTAAYAKRLLKAYESQYGSDALTSDLLSIYDEIANAGSDVDMDSLTASAREVASRILEQSVREDAELYNEYSALRNYLRSTKINVPKSIHADLDMVGGYNQFRKSNMGRMKLSSSDGASIDTVYQELSQQYPGLFDETSYTNPADQLMNMADVLDGIQPIMENPYSSDMEMATRFVASEILESYFDIPQQKPTFADRQQARVEAARAAGNQRISTIRASNQQRIAQLREQGRQQVKNAIQRERAKRAEQIQALKEKYASKESAGSERRASWEVRNKIERHVRAISQKLLTPTDKSNVPESLRKPVAALLDAINLESAYTVDPETGKRTKGGGGDPVKRTAAFMDLRKAYQEIMSSADGDMVVDPALLGDQASGFEGNFDKVIALRDKRLSDMSMSELNTVWQTVRAIEHSISTAGKNLAQSKFARTSDWAYAIQRDTATRKSKRTLTESGALKSLENPYTFFSHYGDAGTSIYKMLRSAQDQEKIMNRRVTEEVQKIVDPKTIKRLEDTTHRFTTERGANLTLTTAQVMELYEMMKQKDARNHLLQGGIVQPKVESKNIRRGTEAILLTADDLSNIVKILTDNDIAIADKHQALMTGILADYGNKASMKAYGYKKFTGKDYWPIKTAKEATYASTEGGENNVKSIKNIGLAKERKPGANNALDISGLFSTFANHAGDMIKYGSWLAPMEDASRLFNFRFKDANGNDTGKTIKGIVDDIGGSGSQKYWTNLMDNIQNGISAPIDDPLTQIATKTIGGFKSASVGGNARVIIQQPTAYFRAGFVLSPADLSRGVIKGVTKGNGWEKALKYSPIAMRKADGGFDISNPASMYETLYDQRSATKKLNDVLSAPAGMADAMTWGKLWNACEWTTAREHKNLAVGSESFYQQVNDLFSDVIDQTQVVDGVLQRSNIMRSRNAIAQQATTFMGEPIMGLNMVMRAYDNFRYETNPQKRGKAIKKLGRAATALVVTNVVNALAQSLIDGLRDDDQDKKYWDRVFSAFTGLTGDEESPWEKAMNVVMGGNVGSSINPLGQIPFVRDVYSLIQGYDVSRTDMEVFSDLVRAAQVAIKSADGSGIRTRSYALKEVLSAGSKIFGIPVGNLFRDASGIVNTVAVETDNIREELDSAEHYAKKATQCKGMDDRLASMYATMSAQELAHVDTLHEQAVRLIQAQRSEGKEVPAGMQAVWDWEHSHMMDRVARIKVLLETARR